MWKQKLLYKIKRTYQLLCEAFNTMKKEDAKKTTDFWHSGAFKTYLLIRVFIGVKERNVFSITFYK